MSVKERGMMTEIALADSSTCITPNPVIRPKSAI